MRDAYEVYDESGLTAYCASANGPTNGQYALNYRELLPRDREAPVLDVGCGTGDFLVWLVSEGYSEVSGVDLSERSVAECRRRGLTGVQQIVDLTGFLDERTDRYALISMNDVIEHLPRDEVLDTLRRVAAALRPDGVFLVKTLNMANPGARYLRYADFTHETGYTETSLAQALLAAGFGSVDVRPYRVPAGSTARRAWLLAGRLWERLLDLVMLLDVGQDRPRVLSKLLLAVARAPRRPD